MAITFYSLRKALLRQSFSSPPLLLNRTVPSSLAVILGSISREAVTPFQPPLVVARLPAEWVMGLNWLEERLVMEMEAQTE